MYTRRPLMIEMFFGTGGWSHGWLAKGGRAIGFDLEHLPHHGPVPDGASLVLQDVLTLHGAQFRDADIICASPPCQAYSYMAMPFSRGKKIAAEYRDGTRNIDDLNALFNACFRIQREACEAAGRYIPMVVENVKGAQPWVGKAKAHFGSFYLYGDVDMVGDRIIAGGLKFGGLRAAKRGVKSGGSAGDDWFAHHNRDSFFDESRKVPGFNLHGHEKTGKGRSFQSAAVELSKQPVWFNDDKRRSDKCGGDWFGPGSDCSLMRRISSKSPARKAASARIARIPEALSSYIAEAFWPKGSALRWTRIDANTYRLDDRWAVSRSGGRWYAVRGGAYCHVDFDMADQAMDEAGRLMEEDRYYLDAKKILEGAS